jgi:hypothetical protein
MRKCTLVLTDENPLSENFYFQSDDKYFIITCNEMLEDNVELLYLTLNDNGRLVTDLFDDYGKEIEIEPLHSFIRLEKGESIFHKKLTITISIL